MVLFNFFVFDVLKITNGNYNQQYRLFTTVTHTKQLKRVLKLLFYGNPNGFNLDKMLEDNYIIENSAE